MCNYLNLNDFSYVFISDLSLLLEQFDASLSNSQEAMQGHYKDVDSKLKALKKRLSSDHLKITYCLDELGIMCAYEV